MTGAPRVLQVMGRSAGGIARHVSQVVAALDGDEMVVDVAAPPDLPITMPKPVIPLQVPETPLRGRRAATARLRSIYAAGRYDVVHAHGLRAGIVAGAARSGGDVRLLVTVHNLVGGGSMSRARATLYGHAENLAVRASDRCFAVSEDMARHLARRAPRYADRIEVLHLGVGEAPRTEKSPAQVRADLQLPDSRRLVVTVARLARQKAVDVLLRAVPSLKDVDLLVVGEGPLRSDLESLTSRLGVEDRVRFLGWRDDVADIIAAADVFCLSSSWEGVPLAAQEAILLGVPVVATAVGGMPELIQDGVSGRLVPEGDPAALARALQAVVESPDRVAGFSRAALEGLHAAFSTEAMLDRLRSAYRERR